MLKLPATTSQQEIIACRGGLDLLTPTLSLKPGVCKQSVNFDCSITGGYSRIKGYERFDGRPNPSDATFATLDIDITGAIVAGDTITGASSGATGVVIYVDDPLVVFTKAVGAFTLGENVEVSAVVQGSIDNLSGTYTGVDFLAQMQNLAADEYRADIGAVPGTGPVRGVLYLGDTVYAFRDADPATTMLVYEKTPSGWVAVPLLKSVEFNTGTAEYVDGDTLTQGGASATVERVCLESGTWGAGTAQGRLILSGITGGPFAAGACAGGGVAALVGAETQIELQPGLFIEFDIGAVGAERRAYGANGGDFAFEFDGAILAPIVTGNTDDTPEHVMVHSSHLFLSFGNSLQHSGIGTPYDWTTTAGAGEFKVDGLVTALKRQPGDQSTATAAVFHENGSQTLYGKSEADFGLVSYEDNAGAKAKTAQVLGQQLYVLDDRGVMGAATAQSFGNFSATALTMPIRPFIQTRRNIATGSVVNREKSQYRVFFSDGYGLYLTLGGNKMLGAMPVKFPAVVRCISSGESPDGTEVSYFGSDDGWVYRLDAGTSFDGDDIEAAFTLSYANQGAARRNKRYRKATLEVQGESFCRFNLASDLSYGSVEREQNYVGVLTDVLLSQSFWDSMTWDEFIWDGRLLNPVECELQGSGENIGFTIASVSDYYDSFTINSIIVTYSPRRQMR